MISDSSAAMSRDEPSALSGVDSETKGPAASSDGASTSDAKFIEFCKSADATFVRPDGGTLTDSIQDSGVEQKLSIKAISLQPVLEHLGPGWNKISPLQSMWIPLCVPVMSSFGLEPHLSNSQMVGTCWNFAIRLQI